MAFLFIETPDTVPVYGLIWVAQALEQYFSSSWQ